MKTFKFKNKRKLIYKITKMGKTKLSINSIYKFKGVILLNEQKKLFEYNVNKLLNVPLYCKDEADKKLLEDVKNKKIVIYTAFTGNYDNLKDPEYIDENCDYVCFTDNPNVESNIWKIIPMEHSNLDNNRKAKQYKLFPHKYLSQYEYSFWLDGTFQIKGSIREYIYKYLKNPILNVIHDERTCIYDEAIVSAGISRYPAKILENQIENYKNMGFPFNYGVVSLGAIFRQHNNPIVIKIMEDWWEEINKFTNQDQVSYSYVCWKNNFHPSISDVYYWKNKYWTKGETYQHNIVYNNSLTSNNLIKNIDNKKTLISNLSPNETYLLFNDLTNLIQEIENPVDYLHSRLFIYQNNERYIIIKGCKREDKNTILFDLKPLKNIQKIIFSPLPYGYVKCQILEINTDGKNYKINNSNSFNKNSDKLQLFGDITPNYEIIGDFSNATFIEIKFSVNTLNKDDLIEIIKKSYKSEKNLNKKINELKNKNNQLLNSKSWKITKPLRLLKNFIKGTNK